MCAPFRPNNADRPLRKPAPAREEPEFIIGFRAGGQFVPNGQRRDRSPSPINGPGKGLYFSACPTALLAVLAQRDIDHRLEDLDRGTKRLILANPHFVREVAHAAVTLYQKRGGLHIVNEARNGAAPQLPI